ncbi:MAG: InlB B-repeat-containing protein, partial [Acutalibacteraceae bacterium]|nr:InlB B-repeat-containing protein [Acutalibacteraceae bacterium]
VVVEELVGDIVFFHSGNDLVKDDVVEGKAGEPFTLPKSFTDSNSVIKGLYLDEDLKEPFTSTVIPEGITHLYVKWGAARLTFKDYPYPSTPGANFGELLSVENSAGVGNGDDYALRWTLDGDTPFNNEELYYKRATQRDHIATIGKVKNGSVYRVTFDYKSDADSLNGYNIRLVSGSAHNIWENHWRAQTGFHTVSASDTVWQTHTFVFTANTTVSGTTLFIEFTSSGANEQTYVNALVDNVVVEELVGDIVFFHSGNDLVKDDVVEGKAGEPFTLPKSFTDSNSVIEGLYLDEDLKEPFTSTVIPEGITHLYVKWKTIVQDYANFKDVSGEFFSVLKGENVGYDDNAALRWVLDGPKTYYGGTTLATHASRGDQYDHVTPIQNPIKDGVVYRVSYYYMATKDTNVDVTITPIVGGSNIWWSTVRKKYDELSTTITKGGCQWTKAEFYISTNILKDGPLIGDRLYLILNTANNNLTNYTDVRIDNVSVELVAAPYVMFNLENGKPNVFVNGKVGDSIVYPENPVSFGRAFKGWYTDKECTTPFTAKTFTEGMTAIVYAGYNLASQFTYDFEEYDFLPSPFTPGSVYMEDALWVSTKYAKSGSGAIEFDRTGSFNDGGTFATIANGNAQFKVDKNRQYILTFSYCVTKKSITTFIMNFVTARDANCWDSTATITPSIQFPVREQEVGVWRTKTVALDFSKIKYDTVFFRLLGGQDGIFLLDDVMVTVVPEGYGAVAIDNGGCKDVPSVLTGKIGTSYADKLTKAPKFEGKYFLGYFEKDVNGIYNELKEDAMKFGETGKTVFARFIDYKVTQDFEGDFVDATKINTGLNIFDFDYELYDATKEGNSRDNVTSGKYSLHRKGDSRYFESSAVLTPGNNIAAGARYKVSFKVKMVKNLHTDGAIKVASSRNQNYSWDTTGDWYPVVAIKDLTDGQWHEVSYIFNSVESFFAIQTPGYVELFIDDVVFDLITDNTPVSTPVQFTEYVPVRRDEKGDIIEVSAGEIDVLSIVDTSLKLGNSGVSTTVIIISVAAGVALVAAAVVLLIVFKKKKAKKA